ncbi:hypothetical protein ACKI2C_50480, partial [Streptomyces brasiliscabiei]|uniref:hypothetical protein n=1 Tax=Streptomyces brasiliscabiei TaxID=2736302 RepID=UPI0038F602E6
MRIKKLPLAIALIVSFSPVVHAENTGAASLASRHEQKSNTDWWPNRLDLSILRAHNATSNPAGKDFNYA